MKTRALLLCGYTNTETTTILVSDVSTLCYGDIAWVTKGEADELVPQTAGKHYLGDGDRRHHFPSDVILIVENEDGCIPWGENFRTLDSVWESKQDENSYEV